MFLNNKRKKKPNASSNTNKQPLYNASEVAPSINNTPNRAKVSSLDNQAEVKTRDINDSVLAPSAVPHFSKPEFRNTRWKSNIPLIGLLFLIVVWGLVVLYSVSAPVGYINSKFETSAYFALSQLKFTIFGLFLVVILNFIPIDFFKNRLFMFVAYGLSAALIILTALAGVEKQGARRWLSVGGTEFQTSEVFKICLVISLAIYRYWIIRLRDQGKLKPKDPKHATFCLAFFEFILPAMAIILLAGLVLVQPHFSCFLILAVVTIVCFLVSGISFRSWFVGSCTILLAAIIIAVPLMIIPSTREKIVDKVGSNFAHVFKRIDIYTQDEEEEMTDQEKDEALQVTRAKDTIGSGGVKGVGLGNSRSKYSYVSESHNDYIFSIYVEETGLIGGVALILFYMVIFGFGLWVAYRAKDVFCRIIATGYTFLIVLEAMWNIGVELTVLPSTGITLPFFSYGGTAQVLLLVAYGMILCVARSGVTYEERGNRHAS